MASHSDAILLREMEQFHQTILKQNQSIYRSFERCYQIRKEILQLGRTEAQQLKSNLELQIARINQGAAQGVLAEEEAADRRRALWSRYYEWYTGKIFDAHEALASAVQRSTEAVGDLVTDALWEQGVNAEAILRALAKTMTAELVTGLVRWAVNSALVAAALAKQTAAIAAENSMLGVQIGIVNALTASYIALAAAKKAASVASMGPVGLLFHGGSENVPRSGNIRRFHAGGGLGSDEYLAVLQGGEGVINRRAMSKPGMREFVSRANRGHAGATTTRIVNHHSYVIYANDAASFQEMMRKKGYQAMEDDVRDGRLFNGLMRKGL